MRPKTCISGSCVLKTHRKRVQVQILPFVLLPRAAKFMRCDSKDIAPRRKGIYGGLTVMVRRALHLSHGSIGPVLFAFSLGTHLWAVQRLLGRRRRVFLRSFYHTRARVCFFLVCGIIKAELPGAGLRATRSFLFNLEPSTLMEVLFAIG